MAWNYGVGLQLGDHFKPEPNPAMFSSQKLFLYRANNGYGY